MWISAWFVRWCFSRKYLPHSSHLNGFSPVWIFKCLLISLAWKKCLPQYGHVLSAILYICFSPKNRTKSCWFLGFFLQFSCLFRPHICKKIILVSCHGMSWHGMQIKEQDYYCQLAVIFNFLLFYITVKIFYHVSIPHTSYLKQRPLYTL